jgi:hypothetical protein
MKIYQMNLLLDHKVNAQEEPFFITKSYRPKRPPTFTEDEKRQFREGMKDVRTDGHNLRFDERRQMYFYLPKDHPEYKEHPEEEESNSWCTIL